MVGLLKCYFICTPYSKDFIDGGVKINHFNTLLAKLNCR